MSCKRFTARRLHLMLSEVVHAHLALLTDLLEHEQVAVALHLCQQCCWCALMPLCAAQMWFRMDFSEGDVVPSQSLWA